MCKVESSNGPSWPLDIVPITEEKMADRGQWGNKVEFVLSVAGEIFGLWNEWRFHTFTTRTEEVSSKKPILLDMGIITVQLELVCLEKKLRQKDSPFFFISGIPCVSPCISDQASCQADLCSWLAQITNALKKNQCCPCLLSTCVQVPSSFHTSFSCLWDACLLFGDVSTPAREESPAGGRYAYCLKVILFCTKNDLCSVEIELNLLFTFRGLKFYVSLLNLFKLKWVDYAANKF